jgi:hypothetical protein
VLRNRLILKCTLNIKLSSCKKIPTYPLFELQFYRKYVLYSLLVAVCIFVATSPIAIAYIEYELSSTMDILLSVIVITALWGQAALYSSSLFFISLDVAACRYLIRQACQLDQTNKLTIYTMCKIREEFQRRVQYSANANNFLMLVAFYNILYVVLALLISDAIEVESMLINFSVMLRELIILGVGCWEIAIVNEDVDVFMKQVGLRIDPNYQLQTNRENEREDEEASSLLLQSDSLLRQRQQLFIYLSADPLSFSIAGMRLTRKDILFRFGIWIVGVVLGLARQKE